MSTKIISSALAAAMLVTMLPVQAAASDDKHQIKDLVLAKTATRELVYCIFCNNMCLGIQPLTPT